MKKTHLFLVGLVLVFAGTGCLGSTADDIVGTWNMVPGSQPAATHTTQMQILDGDRVIITDLNTLVSDTGTYSLSANINNNRFTISGIATQPTFEFNWNAEWHIIHLSENSLIIAAKGGEYGGVSTFDWVRN